MIIEHKDKSFSNIYKSGKLKVSFLGGVAEVNSEGLELLKKSSEFSNMKVKQTEVKEEPKQETMEATEQPKPKKEKKSK